MEPLRDDIKTAIASIEDSLREADSAWMDHVYQGQDEDDLRTARYYVRKAPTLPTKGCVIGLDGRRCIESPGVLTTGRFSGWKDDAG
jgi:hypothetical protein